MCPNVGSKSKRICTSNSVPDITPYLLPPLHPSRFPPTMNDVMPDFQTSYGRKSGLLSLTSRPSCTFAPIALSPPAGAEPPAGEPLPLRDGRSAPIAITHFFPSLSVPVDRGVRRLTRVRTHSAVRLPERVRRALVPSHVLVSSRFAVSLSRASEASRLQVCYCGKSRFNVSDNA